MTRDVFLSYSQPDRSSAFEIVSYLEACGVSVWIAPRDIAPSADWAAEIIEAIASSRLMILVFSSASNESPQVRREVERAVHRQLPILPVRLAEVFPTKSMEYFLSAQHWLDVFPPPLADHGDRLCRQVRALLQAQNDAADRPVRAGAPAVEPAPRFSAEELRLLQGKLADHVGPLAGYLVKRAAVHAVDRGDLIRMLADEIDSPAGRQVFLELCR